MKFLCIKTQEEFYNSNEVLEHIKYCGFCDEFFEIINSEKI